MLVRKPFFFIYILLFFVFDASAQEQNVVLSLKKIIQLIEQQHQVSFNYLEPDIEYTSLIAPDASLSIETKINYLEEKTNLIIEKTSTGYYVISRKKENESFKICGYLKDKNDFSVLENANISSDNGFATTSNALGYFEILTNTATTITISYIGFENKKVFFEKNSTKNCTNFYLQSKQNDLVEVTANRYLTTGISRTTDGTLVLKPKKLGILPGLIEADVLQAMQQIPGINSVDESVTSINVRGGTNDQNLFLWNGIKMYQTGHFFGLISAFNPNLAHTISISKNGSSAFYGESVSSVIDINSTATKLDKSSISAGVNMINADFYAKHNLNKRGFIEIAGRKSITEELQSPTYKEYFEKAFQNTQINNLSGIANTNYSNENKFGFYDFSVKYFQNMASKNRLIIDLITINDQLDVLQKTHFNSDIQSEKNILIQKNIGANTSFLRNWNEKNNSKIDIYASTYSLNANKLKIETNQNLIQENAVLDTGIRLEHRYSLNKKIKLNSGYQFNEVGITNLDQINNPVFLRQIKEVLRSHAIIIEGKLQDTIRKITLNIGLRNNYFEKLRRTSIEPRLQFNFGLSKNWNLELLSELKSQTTFQIIDLQNDYFGIEKRRWILANGSSIPIQKSRQSSLNFTYKKNDWLLSFENFYKKVTGINSSSQGFQNQLEFSKINGSYTVYGFETLFQKKINHFLAWISYSYNDNKYSFYANDPSLFANNFNIKHATSWAAIFEKNNLKLALGSKWSSGKPITTPSNNSINLSNPINPKIDYNSPNNAQLNSFFQVNFSTTYQWKNKKNTTFKAGIAILNIFNTSNEINEYYRINTNSNSIEDVKSFALQRTPNASFRIVF